jgi:hypothetical protein
MTHETLRTEHSIRRILDRFSGAWKCVRLDETETGKTTVYGQHKAYHSTLEAAGLLHVVRLVTGKG